MSFKLTDFITVSNTGITTFGSDGVLINRTGADSYLFFQNSGTNRGAIYGGDPSGNAGLRFYIANNSDPSIVLTSVGNVGIGTTSPTNLSSQTSLTIQGASVSRLDLLGASGAGGGVVFGTATAFTVQGNYGIPLVLDAGDTADMNFNIGGSTKLTISSAGLATFNANHIQGSDTLRLLAPSTILYLDAATDIVFRTNSTAEKMRISSTGLATFVSTYGTSGGELTVGGSSTDFGIAMKFDQSGATSGTIYCSPVYTNTATTLKLGTGSNTNQLVLKGDGNVGIGTSPANGKLEIKTASAIAYTPTSYIDNTSIRLITGGTAATNVTTGVSMAVGGNAEAYIGAVQNSSGYADIVFQSYNGSYSEKMRISSGGDTQFTSVKGSGESLNVKILDSNTNYAQGTGGGLLFQGIFQNNGNIAGGGAIQISKVNSSNGDYSYDMELYTRLLGSALAKRLTISAAGAIIQDTSSNTSTYFQIQNQGTTLGYLGNDSSLANAPTTVTQLVLRSENDMAFTTGGGTRRLTISSTGVANFSQDVYLRSSLMTTDGTTANYRWQTYNNASDDAYIINSRNQGDVLTIGYLTGTVTAPIGNLFCSNGNIIGGAATDVTGTHYFNKGASVNGGILYAGSSTTGRFSLVVQASDSAYNNSPDTCLKVGATSSTSRSVSAAGTFNASGADYAEYMIKSTTDPINKGDIVGVNSDGLLTNIFNDAISFVIKSTDPSFVGNDTWGIESEDKDDIEEARIKVDRVAFSGQVPCNITGATVGDYIIPIADSNGKITGEAISNPTFEQYKISVGKVWKIMEDGRSWVAVKIG